MPAVRRISNAQLEELVACMELHPLIARWTNVDTPRAKLESHRLWEELASRLNSVGDGVTKTAKEWRQYWSDQKCKVKKKGSAMRQRGQGTGGVPSWSDILTPIEERILAIMGVQNVMGNDNVRIDEDMGFDKSPSPVPLLLPSAFRSVTPGLSLFDEPTPSTSRHPSPAVPRPRITSMPQLARLVELMEKRPSLAGNRPSGGALSPWSLKMKEMWEEVAVILNDFPGGCIKSPVAWKTYWHELKYKARKKAANLSCGGPVRRPITEIEKKIIAILGEVPVHDGPEVELPFNEQDTSLDDQSSIEESIEDQQSPRRQSSDPLLTQMQNSSVHTAFKYDTSSDDQSSNQDSIDQQPSRQQSSDQHCQMQNSKTVHTAIRPTYVIPAKKTKTIPTKQEQVLNSEPNVHILKEEWDTIGKSLGIQLRDLDRRQLTIAQKIISDAIFYAKIGKLNEESFILLRPSSPVSAVLPPSQSPATTHCNYED